MPQALIQGGMSPGGDRGDLKVENMSLLSMENLTHSFGEKKMDANAREVLKENRDIVESVYDVEKLLGR